MKHKTWFRLVIKAIGVLVIAFSLPYLIMLIFELTSGFATSGGLSFGNFSQVMWSYGLAQMGQFMLGLYLFFGGKWIVDKCIPSNRPYCPECGYDLSQSSSEKCPECGVVVGVNRMVDEMSSLSMRD